MSERTVSLEAQEVCLKNGSSVVTSQCAARGTINFRMGTAKK